MLNNQSHKHWSCSMRWKIFLNCKLLDTSRGTHMFEHTAWENPHWSGKLYKAPRCNNLLFEGHLILERGQMEKQARMGGRCFFFFFTFMQSLEAQRHTWRYRRHILTFTRWRIINRAELEGRLNSTKGVSLHMWHSHQFRFAHDWAVGSHHSQSSNIHHQTHTFKHI